MMYEKYKPENHKQVLHTGREELQQASRRFIGSLFRSGVNVALLPVIALPREPQQHFLAAGREFAYGWAALVREVADDIEEMVKESNRPTHHDAATHPPEEARKSDTL
jgi:hypothetical protein